MAVLNQNLDDTIDGSFRGVPDRLYADTRHTRKAFACLAADPRDCPKGVTVASDSRVAAARLRMLYLLWMVTIF